MERDFPGPRLSVVPPKNFPRQTTRTQRAYLSPFHTFLPSMHGSLIVPPEQTLAISELVIAEVDSELWLRTRDGEERFDLLEAFGDILSYRISSAFSLLAAEDHLPRIAIDRLVVCREAWSFDVEVLDFTEEKEGANRFLGARRWASDHGLPRFLFIKVPVEDKPFYLDLESPIYVDLFAHAVRRTRRLGKGGERRVKVSEMLPRADQTWLRDAEGRPYTSELRVVAIDRKGTNGEPIQASVAADVAPNVAKAEVSR